MALTSIQSSIFMFIKTHPKQTHADVAAKLCTADVPRIAMNMDALAKRGILTWVEDDNYPYTKRYSLATL
jgi:hypothetical protein